MIKKSELMLRIIGLENSVDAQDAAIELLEKRVKKLEKAAKEKDVKKTVKKVNKKD